MASNYERIDVIESLHGDVVWVGVRGSRVVLNVYGPGEVFLDAAGQEKFAQAGRRVDTVPEGQVLRYRRAQVLALTAGLAGTGTGEAAGD